jgi:hypothetical protein
VRRKIKLRRPRRPPFSKKILVVSVLLVVLAIAVFSMLDFTYLQHAPYVTGEQQASFSYGFWFNAAMSTVGFVVASLLLVFYWDSRRKLGICLFGTVIGSTAIIIGSGLEDCLYFLLGAHGFPANNVIWTWMYEYKYFQWHFWNTTSQILWTIFWLSILAVFVFGMLKFIKKRRL